jgi:colanic acid/amylovoran biosynthesis glycosyltransferase
MAAARPLIVHYLAEYPAATQPFVLAPLRGMDHTTHEVWSPVVNAAAEAPVRVTARRLRRGSENAPIKWLERLASRVAGFELREEWSFSRGLRRFGRPDLVHAHFGPQGYAAGRVCLRARVPLVTTFYGYDLGLVADKAWRRRYAQLWRSGAAFLAEGPRMRSRLVEMGAPPDATFEQPLALSLAELDYRPRQVAAGEEVRLVQVARLVEKKGVDTSIRSVARLRAEGRRVRLRIVGSGPLESALRALARNEGVGESVTFVGSLDAKGALRELADAHLLIQPSRHASDGDTEGGAPYVLLQAQALGLCIVATNHADIPNTVAEPARFLGAEGDEGSVAAALRRALDAASEWARRAEAARRFVEARHGVDVVGRRLEDLYLQVLNLPGWQA